MVRLVPLSICAFAAIACAEAHAAPEIAILQEFSTSGAPVSAVRLGFVRVGDDWQPICAFPAGQSQPWSCRESSAHWFVRYRGKQLGAIDAHGWTDAQAYSTIGLLKVVSGNVPRIGPRDHVFSGWIDAPVHRPLVATNASLSDSAFRWSPDDSNSADRGAALPFVRARAGTVPDCKDGDAAGPGRAIAAADISIAQVWKSVGNERFYSASLAPRLVAKCDFTADSLADAWLYSEGGVAHALPALSEDEATHVLIDIGDFAGDGGEEALFALSGYDEDGFILYYDHFRKSARISWHYH
ncbi:MAG: hypothetical protein ABSC92_14050 [Rhizomicrobium sp.]|jgi:hypothetical protein